MTETADWIARAQAMSFDVSSLVDGRQVRSDAGDCLTKFSPRDGAQLYSFVGATHTDVERAVDSARRAVEGGWWSRAPIAERKAILLRLAALIDERAEELALIEAVEVGKPISDCLAADIPAAAATIRFNAEACDKIYGAHFAQSDHNLSYQLLRPVGVVAGITGWNFPLVLAASKLGPALAAGNGLILKPSELTPLSTLALGRLALEAGVPDGVLNILAGGPHVGALLAQHREIDLVSFTGSTRAGKELLIASGQSNMKRLILECGGKAANIVFGDCPDIEAVANAVLMRAFYNQGEVCTASSRLLVDMSIKERLMEALVRLAPKFQPGDPLRSETRFGALISEAHASKVDRAIETGRAQGAVQAFAWDGPMPHARGFYRGPTIFDHVRVDQPLAQDEIFGPVLSVLTFDTEEEAVRLANATDYGLSAIVWTTDPGRAQRLIQRLRVGWVTVNSSAEPSGGPDMQILPIGGHRQSGLGIEGGLEGLEAYMSKTAVQWYV